MGGKQMERLRLETDEQVLKKGSMLYIQGDFTVKNYFKGSATATECTAILTSKRFVACKERKYFPWGPLIWLIIWIWKRQIVFAIPLSGLSSIKDERDDHMLLGASDGSEYRMAITSLFSKKDRDKWVGAIKDAVLKAFPGTRVKEAEGVVELERQS